MMRFANVNIFGTQTRQQGPIGKARNQREMLPGVRGYRIYDLIGGGADTLTFLVTGRIIAKSLRVLESFVSDNVQRMGQIDTFESTGGLFYENCELVDYRIISTPNYQRVVFNGSTYWIADVQATLEQAGG
jgi:hypothetical protein